jgi:hypothetical protein
MYYYASSVDLNFELLYAALNICLARSFLLQ